MIECDFADFFVMRKTLFCFQKLFRIQVDGDNKSVKSQNLGENEDKDHADEKSRLLRRSADAGVADNPDRVAGGETRQADGQTCSEMYEAPVKTKQNLANILFLSILPSSSIILFLTKY